MYIYIFPGYMQDSNAGVWVEYTISENLLQNVRTANKWQVLKSLAPLSCPPYWEWRKDFPSLKGVPDGQGGSSLIPPLFPPSEIKSMSHPFQDIRTSVHLGSSWGHEITGQRSRNSWAGWICPLVAWGPAEGDVLTGLYQGTRAVISDSANTGLPCRKCFSLPVYRDLLGWDFSAGEQKGRRFWGWKGGTRVIHRC